MSTSTNARQHKVATTRRSPSRRLQGALHRHPCAEQRRDGKEAPKPAHQGPKRKFSCVCHVRLYRYNLTYEALSLDVHSKAQSIWCPKGANSCRKPNSQARRSDKLTWHSRLYPRRCGRCLPTQPIAARSTSAPAQLWFSNEDRSSHPRQAAATSYRPRRPCLLSLLRQQVVPPGDDLLIRPLAPETPGRLRLLQGPGP